MMNRNGGVAKGFRNAFSCIAILLIVIIVLSFKIRSIKTNYTKLHQRVNEIERRLND